MYQKLFLLTLFVLLLGLSGVVQAEPNDANLVGWWKFDEGTGTMIEDSSAYDNNGITVSPTPTWSDGCPIDPCNSGMDFDGLSDYVVCAERDGNNPGTYPAELMPETFTVSCWARLDAFTYYGGFVGNGMDGEAGFFLQGGGNGNNFGLSLRTNDWYDVETPTIYDTDRWYHLAATYDGQNATLYVDGEVAAGPDNIGGPIRWNNDANDYPDNFTIGSWENWDDSYPVDGIIDEVRLYNYAMSVNDIKFLAGFVPGAAANPNPRYGAKDASKYTDLSWTPGSDWAKHDVYFGTNEAAVADANTAVTLGVYMGRQDPNVFSNSNLVPALELTKTYYWRIDEVNETDDTIVKGIVWFFTVPNYIVVDDMEAYNASNEIYDTWLDSFVITRSHAYVSRSTNPTYVHGGTTSMSLDYDNFGKEAGQWRGSWTEAEVANLPIPTSDWTVDNVKALSLYFYGDPLNSATSNDKMYVALDDGTTVAALLYPDVNDIKKAEWQQWNIDMQDFIDQGVTITSTTKMHIGFAGQLFTGQSADGGTGTVWFDDIRLWLTRCVPEEAHPYGDLTEDCFIDNFDLQIIGEDWLASDVNVIATEPPDANLIGWWKFDEGSGDTVADSSAYNNNGVTLDPTPNWVTGHPNDPCDSAFYFDGINPYYMTCAERVGTGPGTYPAELRPDAFSIACWTKLDSFEYYAAFVGTGLDGECGFYLYSAGEYEGTLGLSMATESAGWQDVQPPDIHETDTWYHIAVSYDGRYANFYVDGILLEGPQDVGGPMDWTDASGNYPNHFIIGAWEDAYWSSRVNGTIDEVRFYNYALLPGEVAVLAGLEGEIYVPLDSPANLVPRVPAPAADPQYYPDNPDVVNFTDLDVLADNWLKQVLFP